MSVNRPPQFQSEAQETEWWEQNQDFIADRFEEAKAAGTLGRGTVARLAHERAGESKRSSAISIRLSEADLARARTLAAKTGLPYQTYLKILIHDALDTEERRLERSG